MNDIVVGINFGDEGKGTTVDYLCSRRPVKNVVRFCGGPQTAHNVVMPDGREHTFAQFGSGTLRNVPTLLSRYMMVNPLNMAVEADSLSPIIDRDPFDLTQISEKALLVTPVHRAANRKREINRGQEAHGSCAQGIGETMSFSLKYKFDTPLVGDLLDLPILAGKIKRYREFIEEELGELDSPSIDDIIESYAVIMDSKRMRIVPDKDIIAAISDGYNIFEGSQGILLDEWFGFHPYTTWSTTTSQNAQELLSEAGVKKGSVIGVTRTYSTRHGHGPFPSEFTDPNWMDKLPEVHNHDGRWQGLWRGGNLDLPLLRYAVAATGGVDEISVTHCDYPIREVAYDYDNLGIIVPSLKKDHTYQQRLTDLLTAAVGRSRVMSTDVYGLIQLVSNAAQAPVTIRSYGPTSDDKYYTPVR